MLNLCFRVMLGSLDVRNDSSLQPCTVPNLLHFVRDSICCFWVAKVKGAWWTSLSRIHFLLLMTYFSPYSIHLSFIYIVVLLVNKRHSSQGLFFFPHGRTLMFTVISFLSSFSIHSVYSVVGGYSAYIQRP